MVVAYIDVDSRTGSIRERYQALVQRNNVGGVLLENANANEYETHIETGPGTQSVRQYDQMVADLKARPKTPMFVAEDYFFNDDGISPMQVGASNDADCALFYGYLSGKRMAAYGYNLAFSPIVEIFDDATNSGFSMHASKKLYFGSEPAKLRETLPQVIRGFELGGVIPTMKHFPYVPIQYDPHKVIGTNRKPLEKIQAGLTLLSEVSNDLEKLDIEPVVMTTHTFNPLVDAEHVATFSKTWVSDLLSEAIQDRGLVITDGLFMGGLYKKNFLNIYRDELLRDYSETEKDRIIAMLVEGYSPKTREAFAILTTQFALQAIMAGHDLILLEADDIIVQSIFDNLFRLAQEKSAKGEELKKRIEASYVKIDRIKKKYRHILDPRVQHEAFPAELHQRFKTAISAKRYDLCAGFVDGEGLRER